MNITLIERHGDAIVAAQSVDELYDLLESATPDIGYDRFALNLDLGGATDRGSSVLIHNYPSSWADIYESFNLAETDPVRRAAERCLTGFRWKNLPQLVSMTEPETATFKMGQRYGLIDGYTVARHLPSALSGCCTFTMSPDTSISQEKIFAADALGGLALAQARRLSGWLESTPTACLTDRQRDCVLWAARGKTDWEISQILGIGRETVIQHLKDARLRYDSPNRVSLILNALFDGLIGFSDIFRRR